MWSQIGEDPEPEPEPEPEKSINILNSSTNEWDFRNVLSSRNYLPPITISGPDNSTLDPDDYTLEITSNNDHIYTLKKANIEYTITPNFQIPVRYLVVGGGGGGGGANSHFTHTFSGTDGNMYYYKENMVSTGGGGGGGGGTTCSNNGISSSSNSSMLTRPMSIALLS